MPETQGIDWPVAIGHLHPVLLHLPIGLLVALGALQLFARDQRVAGLRRAHGVLVTLLVLATPAAAVSGWLLHEGAGYGEVVESHEYSGIALTFLVLGIGIAFVRRSTAYGWLVGLACVILLPTAHLGGSLTHGEDFLLGPFLRSGSDGTPALEPVLTASDRPSMEEPETRGVEPDPVDEPGPGEPEPVAAAVPAAAVPTWADAAPILDRYCSRCHGERRQRGGLTLQTLEGALAGGDIGPALVPGDLEGSLLWTRLQLPLDHEDHMPPASKSQPRPEEIELLRAWVLGVPAMDTPPGQGPAPAEAGPPAAPEPDGQVGVPGGDLGAAIAALTARRVHVQAVEHGSDWLWIDVGGAQLEAGELGALLSPLSGHVLDLAASRQPLDDDDLRAIGQLAGLERLDLRSLPGEARSLAGLKEARSLRRLNLAGTPLDEDAAEVIATLPALESAHLWGTGVDSGLLAAERPGLKIQGAAPEVAEPVEVEPEVRFRRPGEVARESGEDPAPSPINEACPVSGQPVLAAHTRVVGDQVIGFCCPNCPATFDADPGKYLAALGLEADGTPRD